MEKFCSDTILPVRVCHVGPLAKKILTCSFYIVVVCDSVGQR